MEITIVHWGNIGISFHVKLRTSLQSQRTQSHVLDTFELQARPFALRTFLNPKP